MWLFTSLATLSRWTTAINFTTLSTDLPAAKRKNSKRASENTKPISIPRRTDEITTNSVSFRNRQAFLITYFTSPNLPISDAYGSDLQSQLPFVRTVSFSFSSSNGHFYLKSNHTIQDCFFVWLQGFYVFKFTVFCWCKLQKQKQKKSVSTTFA